MVICSAVVVVTLEGWRALAPSLAEDPRITLGPSKDGRVAIVIEADSTREVTQLFRSLEDREGVVAVYPVYHAFEEEVVQP